ncbi:hypothetical protein BZG36_03749 [Bifiguratus adelaidae]|uniref:beta-galactosidase n=1 Tax=Bifiguratus adelaidae TaxID=1938954 RepID=A0A261XY28_9FUNG|nr:hypothetical protein BZG36_03749 [Bifiguratus adelaidae]
MSIDPSIAAAVALLGGANAAVDRGLSARSIPATSSNDTGPVTWDKYSLMINGQRTFLFCGEFHYYRLPSPDLWRDVLEKMKAANYNAASVYFNWDYHSAKQGVYDFQGVRDIQKLFDIAKEVGIYIVTRPGPYINAEDDSTTDQGYTDAWMEWLSAVDPYFVKNQITQGGQIILNQIENEFGLSKDGRIYMQNLEYKFRDDGLKIPFTFNDVSQTRAYYEGVGSVDIYGQDSYPLGFDCSHPTVWPKSVQTNYRNYYNSLNISEPHYIPEFQGGSFDPWGGPGYAACGELTNERFAKVYYKNNYAQGLTMQSLYMSYGGTSWGALAAPVVYTSYDYGAPISEGRLLTPKYNEIKLQATFLHTATPILTTEYVNRSVPDNTNIVDSVLQSVQNGMPTAQFHVLRQVQTSSITKQDFHVNINITEGEYTLPQKAGTYVTLNGRDSKILTAGYDMSSHRLLYSTSELFSHSNVGSREVAMVYAYPGEYGETTLAIKSKATAKAYSGQISSNTSSSAIQINYQHSGVNPIVISSHGSPDLLLYVADYTEAVKFWAPEINNNTRVFVYGPYLVRDATLTGSTLYLRGDVNGTTQIEVAAPENVRQIRWNNQRVQAKQTKYGTWTATLGGPSSMSIPDLSKQQWKFSPASPETSPNFDDSQWTVASNNALGADKYGYHVNSLWYRGEFAGGSNVTGITLETQGGTGYGYAVWINGNFSGGFSGNSSVGSDTRTFAISSNSGKNVVSVLVFTVGHDEEGGTSDSFKHYRGLGNATLVGSSETITWKIQGNLGGEDILDTIRGPLNEGGLYGERAGWHLPGYPGDANWTSVSLPHQFGTPQVAWYRTNFTLNAPSGMDVPLGVQVTDSDRSTMYRALLFINGWQFGRYANNLGPQTLFYVPEGILNYHGQNTMAVAVIPLEKAAVKSPQITLKSYGTFTTDLTVTSVNSPAWSPRPGYQ